MSGRIVAMEICLEQLLECPNKMVYDEQKLHFKRWECMKYKTLKTAFIKDMMMEGFKELKKTTRIKKTELWITSISTIIY